MVANKTEGILQTFVHVQDGGKIQQIAVTEAFWSDLLSGARPELDQGRLMSAFSFSQDWPKLGTPPDWRGTGHAVGRGHDSGT